MLMRKRYVARGLVVMATALVALMALVTPAYAQGARFIFGEDFTLESGDELNGGLAVFGGSVALQVDSQVNGDVFISGGDMEVAGRITGGLTVLGGDVWLQEGALVMGDLVTVGGTIRQDAGAVVLGERVSGGSGGLTFPAPDLPGVRPVDPEVQAVSAGLRFVQRVVATIFSALALAALGVVLLLFLERPIRRMQDTMVAAPWASLGMGLLTLVVVTAVATILAITVCLSPIALLLLIVLLIALLLGWTVAGLIVGERLLKLLRLNDPSPLLAVVVGVALLTVLTQIPCLGWLLGLLVASLGLGAVVLTRAGTVPYPLAEPAPASAGLDDALWGEDMADYDESALADGMDETDTLDKVEGDTPQ
jgi:hypothetical protein